MSLLIVLLIMLGTGIFGGMLNWALQGSPNSSETANQSRGRCVLVGIGATILIPLFLEIAQSKLLDNMHTSWSLIESASPDTTASKTVVSAKPAKTNEKPGLKADTVKKGAKDTSASVKGKDDCLLLSAKNCTSKKSQVQPKKGEEDSPLKDYLLFGAYCLLAAAAGPRFINGLLDGVLKDKQIATLAKEKKVIIAEKEKAIEEKDEVVQEKEKVIEEKDKIEKVKTKLIAQNQLAAERDEIKALTQDNNLEMAGQDALITPAKKFELGPIIHEDDPQKGRFGGKSESNGRVLKAEVKKSSIPEFYHVKIWVESTDPTRPLDQDVTFYIHDSFRPSVYTIKVDEFKNGKALDDEILSYGAFTVGVVTDGGETMLELDLAEQTQFPAAFRNR